MDLLNSCESELYIFNLSARLSFMFLFQYSNIKRCHWLKAKVGIQYKIPISGFFCSCQALILTALGFSEVRSSILTGLPLSILFLAAIPIKMDIAPSRIPAALP